MTDFLTGLEYCGLAFGIVLVAIIPLPFLIWAARWFYPAHVEDDSSNSGAIEGSRDPAMSRDEAHLYTDECA